MNTTIPTTILLLGFGACAEAPTSVTSDVPEPQFAAQVETIEKGRFPIGPRTVFDVCTNVVATLWRVEDEGAAAFAAAFYRELRAPSRSGVASSSEATPHPTSGRPISVAEALVRAQRAMMRDARFSAPYYWAGYRLSGTGTLSGLQRP